MYKPLKTGHQWYPLVMGTTSGCNRMVTTLKRFFSVSKEYFHLDLERSGCNKEVAALHSDHYAAALVDSWKIIIIVLLPGS